MEKLTQFYHFLSIKEINFKNLLNRSHLVTIEQKWGLINMFNSSKKLF